MEWKAIQNPTCVTQDKLPPPGDPYLIRAGKNIDRVKSVRGTENSLFPYLANPSYTLRCHRYLVSPCSITETGIADQTDMAAGTKRVILCYGTLDTKTIGAPSASRRTGGRYWRDTLNNWTTGFDTEGYISGHPRSSYLVHPDEPGTSRGW